MSGGGEAAVEGGETTGGEDVERVEEASDCGDLR